MIHTMGDSHSWLTFSGIDNIDTHHVGPVTMKRVGNVKDDVMSSAIKNINFVANDVLIICFGEIDVRCYVKPILERKPDLQVLLQNWTDCYLDQIKKLAVPSSVKVYVMSVVPPSSFDKANTIAFPVAGSDSERALYTKEINRLLYNGCRDRALGYFDVYSKYVNEEGLLRFEDSDGIVHISNPTHIKQMFEEMGLLC